MEREASAERSCRGAVTLLVLLAAPARTQIVAADLRLIAFDGLDHVVAADPRRLLLWTARDAERAWRRLGAGPGERRRRGRAGVVENQRRLTAHGTASHLGFFVQHRPQPPDVSDDLPVDTIFHGLEERKALFLVLDQRIALAVAAQPDAFLEVVQAIEVILPLPVDDLQHDVAFDAPHELRADQLFLLVIVRDYLVPQDVADLSRPPVAEVERRRIDGERRGR